MTDVDTAKAHLAAAMEALAPSTVLDQASDAARIADLAEDSPGLWAHVRQVAGGFWVTVSYDPVQTPFGSQVPEGSNRNFACGNFDEVCAVLASRFGVR